MASSNLMGQGIALHESTEAVIHYEVSTDLADPVSKLQRDLDSGKAKLEFEQAHGYLPSLLKKLDVPVSSQVLVYSKTSCQAPFTNPKTPRAIYNGGATYVGWAQGDPQLDVVSIDPVKGPIFYTLEQKAAEIPHFTRQNRCMQCHIGPKTLEVPGLMLRSNYTSQTGRPLSQIIDFVPGHNSPLQFRWGGWYVTGTHEGDLHLGNVFLEDVQHPETLDLKKSSNVTDLSPYLSTSAYLAPSSDTVALLVLDHETRMQNLITQAQYEAQLAKHDVGNPQVSPGWPKERLAKAAEPLVAYMLFCDEAPLHGLVKGTSSFADEFVKLGPRDSRNRSLREFDLKKRLFKYPCSFLIYSSSFDALPPEMKDVIWGRLSVILAGKDPAPIYANLTADDQRSVEEILMDTKPEFRAWMLAHPRA